MPVFCQRSKAKQKEGANQYGTRAYVAYFDETILCLLGKKGKLRFTEITMHISDISQKMQTATLRSLEADGLIVRKLFPEVPPRVEYELSKLGESLIQYIDGLAGWALDNMPEIKENRKKNTHKQERRSLPFTRSRQSLNS